MQPGFKKAEKNESGKYISSSEDILSRFDNLKNNKENRNYFIFAKNVVK